MQLAGLPGGENLLGKGVWLGIKAESTQASRPHSVQRKYQDLEPPICSPVVVGRMQIRQVTDR